MIIRVLIFTVGALSGGLGTLWSILLARKHGILDYPGPRSSHGAPIPRIGGIGIALPLFVFNLTIVGIGWFYPRMPGKDFVYSLVIGGCGCFGFGLLDDLKGMKAGRKLVLQCACALVPILLGLRIHTLARFMGLVLPEPWGRVAALCWILLMINSFNFMDGMNGIAATFAVTSSALISLIVIPGSLSPALANLPLLTGICLGFLFFNLTPAATFMGDSGSQLLGFTLALVPLSLHSNDPETYPFGSFVLILLPFLYDVLYTLVRRITRGENLFQAHRTHLYQRLLVCGWSHPKVLRLVFITFVLCGILGIGFAGTSQTRLRIVYTLAALLIMIIYTGIVWSVERRRKKDSDSGKISSPSN